jgi:polyketide biosynthesis acyl carrier protein
MQTADQTRVFDVVKRNLLAVLPDLDPQVVALDKSLTDLGCNSLDRADVVTMTMEQLAIDVPVEDFAKMHDLRTLVEVLAQRLR